ncbi:MAG TPA: ATP-binding protein [Vicinamibacterales bacterium]|jgi:PAS domain S-box-containing protein
MGWLRTVILRSLLAGCLVVTALLSSTLGADTPQSPVSSVPSSPFADQWRWIRFTVASGLPSDRAFGVVQVPGDGLWATAAGGVSRYDGHRWLRVPVGPDEVPSSLTPDGHGGVVGVTEGLLVAGDARGLRTVRIWADGGNVRFLTQARAATGPVLLLGGNQRLYQWDGSRVSPYAIPAPVGTIERLVQAGPHAVWASTTTGLWSFNGDRWSLRLADVGAPFILTAAHEGPNGHASAWLQHPGELRGFLNWRPGRTPTRSQGPLASPAVAIASLPNGDSVLVHTTGQMTLRVGTSWTEFPPVPGRLGDARDAGYLPNGDLWVATDHGLFFYRASSPRWRTWRHPPEMVGNSVNRIVQGRDGTYWLATDGGVEHRDRDGRLMPLPATPGVRESVTALAVDGNDRVWIGSGDGFLGVRWLDRQGWHRFATDPVLDRAHIHAIEIDRRGHVWCLGLAFGAQRGNYTSHEGPGAFEIDENLVVRWARAQGLPSDRVYAFQEGPDGARWFGTSGGLSRWMDGRWQHWTPAEGLRRDRVFTLAIDVRGRVWFGQQGPGLGYIDDGQVRYVPKAEGLIDTDVWQVCAGRDGRLWVGATGGVSMLRDGVWTSFDDRSGLSNTRAWPLLPEDDRVLIGTRGGGTAILDLRTDSGHPPTVELSEPLIEGNRVVVRWTPFSWWAELPNEAVPTRLRVDDGPWSPWSTIREQSIPNLPAGSHVIAIQAKNALGEISPQPAQMHIQIAPSFYARPVFFVPLIVLAALAGTLGTVLVVKQRRHAVALREREERFAKAFQSSPLASSITTLDESRVVDVNAALVRQSGRSRDEIIGKLTPELLGGLSGYDHDAVRRELTTKGYLHGVPIHSRSRSGDPVDAIGYFEVFDLSGRACVLAQFLDVTEQRRLESELLQAQKMESVGRLAGGVAHDFNNLLTVIIGNTALLDNELMPGDPRRSEIEQIRIASERAERLTRQLLAFARKQRVEPRVVDVNGVLVHTDRMLRRLIGADIEIVTLLGSGLDRVEIDPSQLEQVVLNMVINARDAMPKGGTLTIRTANVTLDEREARQQPEAAPGPHVLLEIADTGEGMDPATLARVFEPFFTTKPQGKGTGLGLATCYGIIRQAGGHIRAISEPGRGTAFKVFLPKTDKVHSAPESDTAGATLATGAETILVAEDETQVRQLAAHVLRSRGYQVLEAGDGSEALSIAEGHHASIDLLLTDIVMPQMRGTELAVRLREQWPDVAVLFMSGYADSEATRDGGYVERSAFIAKPFKPNDLGAKVRELLDQAPPRG